MCGTYDGFLRGCHCDNCLTAVRRKHVKRVKDDAATEVPTGELVEKRYCKAYDVVAKRCCCGREHGSSSTYTNHACRCDACKEARSECRREWYAANRERQAEYKREHYTANKERYAERAREWREANKGYHAERNREWREANPDRVAAKNQRRRARKNNAPGNLHDTAVHSFWWNGLLDLYEQCPVCLVRFDNGDTRTRPTLEHIVAIANGGEHSTQNSTILCGECNSSKGAKDMDAWLIERRRALGLPPLT